LDDPAGVRDSLGGATRRLGHACRAFGSVAEARPFQANSNLDAILICSRDASANSDQDGRGEDMHEIICPHYEKASKIDDTGYADIVKQVRDGEFEQQLHERLDPEQDKRNAVELATTNVASEMQRSATAKDTEIQGLKAKLEAVGVTQKLAIAEAVSTVAKEHYELKSGLERAALEKQIAEKSLKDKYETQIKGKRPAPAS
jgi:hypothetical protein